MKDGKEITFELNVIGQEVLALVDGVAVDRIRWDDSIDEVFVFVRDADGREMRVVIWRRGD